MTIIWIFCVLLFAYPAYGDSGGFTGDKCKQPFNNSAPISNETKKGAAQTEHTAQQPINIEQYSIRSAALKEEAEHLLQKLQSTHPNDVKKIEQLDHKLHQIIAEGKTQMTTIIQELKRINVNNNQQTVKLNYIFNYINQNNLWILSNRLKVSMEGYQDQQINLSKKNPSE